MRLRCNCRRQRFAWLVTVDPVTSATHSSQQWTLSHPPLTAQWSDTVYVKKAQISASKELDCRGLRLNDLTERLWSHRLVASIVLTQHYNSVNSRFCLLLVNKKLTLWPSFLFCLGIHHILQSTSFPSTIGLFHDITLGGRKVSVATDIDLINK